MIDVRLVPPLGDNVTFVPRTPFADRMREHALRIVRDTIEAADPRPLVTRAIHEMHLDPDQVTLVSVGKAAVAMAAAARAALGSDHLNGVVVAPIRSGAEIPGLHVFEAAHPLPGASSVAAAEAVVGLLEVAYDAGDVLLLLSGGASSLLAYPAGDVTIEDYARVTSLLLEHGAGIHALNSVRKHIDQLKGGQLARLAAPARVHALLLSDVVDDREDTIGSGPAAPDTTTYQEAIWNLHTAECWAGTPERVRRHLERGRDGELDLESGREETGWFGINIHRASLRNRSIEVGRWSAGCQVIADPRQFDLFMDLCEEGRRAWGNVFTYTLLHQRDF